MELLVVIMLGGCLLLTFLIWLYRRETGARAVAQLALAPIVGRTRVTQDQLRAWHLAHAESIERWIRHHERVLEQFADTRMAIDLTANLTNDDEQLGAAMDLAISQHPESQMRARLSRLAVAKRNTLDSLRRSNWSQAKVEHVVYLQHRDAWRAHVQAFARAEGDAADRES